MSKSEGSFGRNLGLAAVGVAVAAGALYVYSSSSSSTTSSSSSGSAVKSTSTSSGDPVVSPRVMKSVINLLNSPATAARGLDVVLRLTAYSDSMSDFNKEGGMVALTPLLSDEDTAVRLKAFWVAANMCMDPVIGEELLAQGGLIPILQEAKLASISKGADTQSQISSCALQALLNLSAQTKTQELLMKKDSGFIHTLFALAAGTPTSTSTSTHPFHKLTEVDVSSLQVQWQAIKIFTNLSIENTTKEVLLDLGLCQLITRLLGEVLSLPSVSSPLQKKGSSGEEGEDERKKILGLMRYRLLQMLSNLIGYPSWLKEIRDSKLLQEHLQTLLTDPLQHPTEEERTVASLLISRSSSGTTSSLTEINT